MTDRFRRADIEHARIGGLAPAAHGVVRATGGVDRLVDGDRADAAAEILAEVRR